MNSPHSYFNQLNYTLANEDTRLELDLLPKSAKHVLSVAGSGSRVLPLLAKAPKRITCVDLSPEQLWLTGLRMECLRQLEWEEYLAFWGYPSLEISRDQRKGIFVGLDLSESVPPNGRSYLRNLFESKNWESVLYDGKWERTFRKLSKVVQKIIGKKGIGVFECKSLSEQQDYLANQFPAQAWKLALRLVGNATIFNQLLYRGKFPRKNFRGSLHGFYVERYQRLFREHLARTSFFLQLSLLGRIQFPEGCPIECDREVFRKAKAAVSNTELVYKKGDVTRVVKDFGSQTPVDFLSFSDVPSYFTGTVEKNFLQTIRPGLASDARIVFRNYLHTPERVDLRGYQDTSAQHRFAISREGVQVYDVQVLEVN